MNRLNRRMYALLLTITVAATNATYGMEPEVVNAVSTEQQQDVAVCTAWYRKRSTKVISAVIAGAAIVYTVAAYMNKVSSPAALWNNLFTPVLPFSNNSDVVNNNGSTNTNSDSFVDAGNDNNNVSDNQDVTDGQSANTDDASPVVTNEDNNTDVVTTDVKQNEVVVTQDALLTPIQKNFQIISKKFFDLKNTGSKKAFELKDAGVKKFHELNDAWNRGE